MTDGATSFALITYDNSFSQALDGVHHQIGFVSGSKFVNIPLESLGTRNLYRIDGMFFCIMLI